MLHLWDPVCPLLLAGWNGKITKPLKSSVKDGRGSDNLSSWLLTWKKAAPMVYAYCSERPQFFSLRVCLIVGRLLQTHQSCVLKCRLIAPEQHMGSGIQHVRPLLQGSLHGLEDHLCTGTRRRVLLLGSSPTAVRELTTGRLILHSRSLTIWPCQPQFKCKRAGKNS